MGKPILWLLETQWTLSLTSAFTSNLNKYFLHLWLWHSKDLALNFASIDSDEMYVCGCADELWMLSQQSCDQLGRFSVIVSGNALVLANVCGGKTVDLKDKWDYEQFWWRIYGKESFSNESFKQIAKTF